MSIISIFLGVTEIGAMYANPEKIQQLYKKSHPSITETELSRISAFSIDISSSYPSRFIELEKDGLPEMKVPLSKGIELLYPLTIQKCTSECVSKCEKHFPIEKWEDGLGIIKCMVLPPRDVRFPILTTKIKQGPYDVMVATLCHNCASKYTDFVNAPICQCPDKLRQYSGCWHTQELVYAMKQGYKIIHIYHSIFWLEYSSSIAQSMMKILMKLKICSSGIPKDVKNLESYAKELSDRTNLHITADDLKPNNVLRTVAKLISNAWVGKNAQRVNISNKTLVYTLQQFAEIESKTNSRITYFEVVSNDCLLVHEQPDESKIASYTNGSLFIPSLCNALSRLALVKTIDLLEKNSIMTLYCDTDSIYGINMSHKSILLEKLIRIDSVAIGMWKVELEVIDLFICLQKKSYCLYLPPDKHNPNGSYYFRTKGFNKVYKSIIILVLNFLVLNFWYI